MLAALAVFLGCSFPVNVHVPLLGDFGGIHFAGSDPLLYQLFRNIRRQCLGVGRLTALPFKLVHFGR